MSDKDEEAKVTADIADDVIREALASVEARERGETPKAPTPEGASTPEAGAEAPATGGEHSEVAELQAQLELSQAKGRETMDKLRDTHERMLRAAADLENYRKRAQKEKEEAQRFGIEKLLRDLLPVVDNLERALEHAGHSEETQALATGVKMTLKLFQDALAKHGVKGFESKGKAFDPHQHEAMSQAENAELPVNTVLHEVQRGYTIHERLLRPALVVVSKLPEAPEPVAAEAATIDAEAGDGSEATEPAGTPTDAEGGSQA